MSMNLRAVSVPVRVALVTVLLVALALIALRASVQSAPRFDPLIHEPPVQAEVRALQNQQNERAAPGAFGENDYACPAGRECDGP